jgi:hypothetical protein
MVDLKPGDPRLFSIRTFAADIAAFIEAHRLAPIIIGGISMGAASTLHLAVHRPEIVRGLILVRPAWIAASAPANNSPNAQVGRLLMDLSQEDAREAFEVSETARLLAEIAPDNLASLRGFFSREPQATTAALLQAIAGDGPGVSEENLCNLETPTLIIGLGRTSTTSTRSHTPILFRNSFPVPGLSRLHRKPRTRPLIWKTFTRQLPISWRLFVTSSDNTRRDKFGQAAHAGRWPYRGRMRKFHREDFHGLSDCSFLDPLGLFACPPDVFLGNQAIISSQIPSAPCSALQPHRHICATGSNPFCLTGSVLAPGGRLLH